jgi:hypothetical protein
MIDPIWVAIHVLPYEFSSNKLSRAGRDRRSRPPRQG